MSPIPASIKKITEKFESGFLGFWIRKYRISYLFIVAIVVMGSIALATIQKESSPNIKFGMVVISTVYPGTNPTDMDALVTEKLYKEVKDIQGSKKITTTSSLGVSSITIELEPETDTMNFMTEVRNNIGRVILPKDAKSPNVLEIKTDTNRVYDATFYSPNKSVSLDKLRILGQKIKDELSTLPEVEKIEYGNTNIYDIRIVFDENVMKAMNLTLDQVAATIRSYHQDAPIGNFGVGDRNYDFRIGGKFSEAQKFLEVPITLKSGKTILVGEMATIERYYKDTSINRIGFPGGEAFESVNMTIMKNDNASIFAASKATKDRIAQLLATPEFSWIQVGYSMDLADTINDDYKELAREAIITISLVFIVMWLFVGFFDALFATLTLPLAFFGTFILLDTFGFSLNFLTNFSFILSFGIAVDTIIVIVQAASAKIRVGHEPRSAIMIALREYALPISAGVMTTILAFLPMMVLPGIMGKFLAYIPITIFGVLASGLVLALTVNTALYIAFVKGRKQYVHNETILEYADKDEQELLAFERIGKTEIQEESAPLRIRIIHHVTAWYKKVLRVFLENTFLRRASILWLVGILILSFVPILWGKSLAGHVGFNLFPGADNGFVSYSVYGATGERVLSMDRATAKIAEILSKYEEIKFYTMTTKDVKNSTDPGITLSVTLKKIDERKELGLMDVFAFDKAINADFDALRQEGFEVASEVQKGGPPAGKAVALKLVATDTEKLDTLAKVAEDFEKKIRSYPGSKNVENSSGDTPGQFIFSLKKDVITTIGLSPSVIIGEMLSMMNGVGVGTLTHDGEDLDVILKYEQFIDVIQPENVLAHTFSVGSKTYRLGDFIEPVFKNAVASVNREAGLVTVTVGADFEEGINATEVQSQFTDFAKTYNFPAGISYKTGGENAENADLVMAVLVAFFIALLAIFALLTLLFNSFTQPVIVLYSVIMSLPYVMIGLLLTDNQFSLPFGIGFIAFTGIAVNHGIILIDAININLRKGMASFTALVEAGSSRLEPMLLTTLTTALGILPIALRDKFWSGLGFTIIFGLIACTFITLFVVKGLYYETFMVEHHFGRKLLRGLTFIPRFLWSVAKKVLLKKRAKR